MIKNKKILITGGSSGLGSELINELLKHNNKIYHLGRFIEEKKNLKTIICNLENIKDIKKRLKKLLDIQKIDYVFLNAGVLGAIKKITDIKFNDLEKVFKINPYQLASNATTNRNNVFSILGISASNQSPPGLRNSM